MHNMQILIRDTFGLSIFMDPFRHLLSFKFEVRSDPACIEILVLYIYPSVNNDHRDPRILCFLQHEVPSGLRLRRKHDIVYILLDKHAQRRDLVGLLLLAVLVDQIKTVLLRERRLHGFCIGTSPVRLCAEL